MILAVAGKDLLRLRRDRFGLAFALGFPAAFAVAFFFMLGPGLSESAEDAPPPTITLATGESGAQAFSQVLIDALLESPVEGFEFRSVEEAAAGAELESGEITGYILFAPDFGEGVFSEPAPGSRWSPNPTRSNRRRLSLSLARSPSRSSCSRRWWTP